jgi:hypothetical protein
VKATTNLVAKAAIRSINSKVRELRSERRKWLVGHYVP